MIRRDHSFNTPGCPSRIEVGRQPTWPKALATALLFLVPFAAAGAAEPQTPETQTPYSVLGKKVYTTSPTDAAVIRSQPIAIHWPALDRLVAKAGTDRQAKTLELPLFDRTLELQIDDVFPTLDGWALTTVDNRATLVWGNGRLQGSINDGRAAYRIRSTRDDQVLEAVDQSAYPPCPGSPDHPIPKAATTPVAPKDSGNEIDLLVIYTDAVPQAVGDVTTVRQTIELGVAETNAAFVASGVQTQLRLLDIVEVEYDEGNDVIGTHLERLTDPDDGYLDDIHGLRDTLRADLVTMIGYSTFGGCGIAWTMQGPQNTAFESLAFSYTAFRCISPNYTFGHEIGHALGSSHAPDDPDPGPGAYDYSYGYKDTERKFRSIMSYSCGSDCLRLLRWSNPEQMYDGRPLGSATQNNALGFNQTRHVVANFRQPVGGRLRWAEAEVTVEEYEGSVSVSVVREGLTDGEAQVTWTVHALTAELGEDVEAATGIVRWGAGQGGEQTFEIPIFDDPRLEGDELFTVELSEPSANTDLGDLSVLTVTIRDNEIQPFVCHNSEFRLCLGDTDPGDGTGPRPGDGRFAISVNWRNADGAIGPASVVPGPSGTTDSGLLWFFTPQNWEMLIKVLDGCALNDHYWVLFAAGTDVEYELLATDTIRGKRRVYKNAQGTPARAISDTEAFATCP